VAWWVLLVAIVLAIFFSLVWTCLFQCLGGCCIWTSIVGCLVVIFILGIYVLVVGITQLKDSTEADKTNNYVFIGFGALLLLIGVILILILIFLRKRINLAIDLIKEAGRVLRNSWCIILIPICYILIFIVATVLFVITIVYFCSSMDVSIEGGQRDLVMNNSQRGILLVSFFIYLWVLFFLVGMNQTTLAGVGASYYFAHSDDERPTFPIARTLKIIFLHHLGSVAVGSCLIAIVAFIRAVVMYLQKQAKKSQNKAAQMCLKCLQCCLGCLQRIVEYITSRAYVMMMIHGKGFFHSAYDGIRLVMRNFIRSSIVGSIAKLVVFFGIFVIMLLTTFVCIVILRPDFLGASEPFLHVVYWWLIVLVCVIISFTVAYLMMSIYDFLVTTIFLCFLQDEEMAQTNGGQYVIYASEDLRSHMEVAKQKGQEMLDKDQQKNAE
ncbi:MAG: putative solute carrier family 44, partial [Streblomastix strix]